MVSCARNISRRRRTKIGSTAPRMRSPWTSSRRGPHHLRNQRRLQSRGYALGHAQTPAGPGQPTFFDLVSVLAEPISLYLGDSTLPDGESMENLEIARLYIDLLEVLRQKSAGNLDPEEQKFLDELLYRIRMRYVQKRG